jgi:hypothetical protein
MFFSFLFFSFLFISGPRSCQKHHRRNRAEASANKMSDDMRGLLPSFSNLISG